MIPLARTAFWGPMAVAIMGGLTVATVLTLVVLPAMYRAWLAPAPKAAVAAADTANLPAAAAPVS
jgi:multidrug efflux pump